MVTYPQTAAPPADSEVLEALAWLFDRLMPIRVLDTGDRAMPNAWAPLTDHVQHVICDPFAEEADEDGRTVRRTALSVYGGHDQLNITRDPSRSSLLEPNHGVVARYGAAADFEVVERRPVATTALADLTSELGMLDVLRLRTQGLEYPVLSSALPTVRDAVCVEVEGGLLESYVGQYPLAVVDPLLHGAGYTLVALETRSCPPAGWNGPVQQRPTEYQGMWLKDDLLTGAKETSFEQAVKLLLICKALGHYPFGHELAVSLHDRSLLPWDIARVLRTADFWKMPWKAR